jgi:hypothetical protein
MTESVFVFASIDNTSAIVPGTSLFHDDFEYTAGRDDSTVASIFQAHGWSEVLSEQTPNGDNTRGYIYTTDTIPGYAGMLPGANSSSVLALEALPTTLGN